MTLRVSVSLILCPRCLACPTLIPEALEDEAHVEKEATYRRMEVPLLSWLNGACE